VKWLYLTVNLDIHMTETKILWIPRGILRIERIISIRMLDSDAVFMTACTGTDLDY